MIRKAQEVSGAEADEWAGREDVQGENSCGALPFDGSSLQVAVGAF